MTSPFDKYPPEARQDLTRYLIHKGWQAIALAGIAVIAWLGTIMVFAR